MTEVALPLQTSLREDGDEDIPFKVINTDNLPMTVLGERIFKPFGSENLKRKPNGIVYPTRRVDLGSQQVNQQKHLAKSNGQLYVPQKLSSNNSNFRKLSASQGNLNNTTKLKTQDDFTKNLDAKLKKLQTERRRNDAYNLKKPFITTVKKGQFLEAPEVSPPSNKTSRTEEEELNKRNVPIKKQLYAFVSKPMVLSRSPPQNVHRSRCEAAAIAAGVPYTTDEKDTTDGQRNRRKREARTSSPEKQNHKERSPVILSQKNELPKWNPYFAYAKLLSQEEVEAKKTREEMAKRRAIARKKARMQSSKKTETINRTKNVTLVTTEIQTENYLQAILLKPPIIDSVVQTDIELLDGLIGPKQVTTEAHDEETQIIPGDLFDFDEEMQPVLEVLVGKTIETALIEILEEEELAALKEQQRRYLEMRAEEQRIAGEILEKHFVERLHRNNKGGASVLLENYLSQLIPPVLEELHVEGVIPENKENGSFVPWLIEEVTIELGDILSTGDVLNGIIRDILSRRKELSTMMDTSDEQEEKREVDNSLEEQKD